MCRVRTIGPSDAPSASGSRPEPPRMLRPRSPAVPDVAEERRHRRLRDLVGIGERAVRERLEDAERVGVQAAEEAGNVSSPRCLSARRRTSASVSPGPAREQLHVRVGVALDLQAGARERDAARSRERQAERQQLGAHVAHHAPAEVDVEHRAGDRHDLQAELGHELPDHGVGRREHVRADAQREVAALLRPDAAADAVGGLEQHGLAVAQAMGGDEAGDAPADDHDVLILDHRAQLLSVMSSARASWPAALRTSGAISASRASPSRTSGPVTETIATGRPAPSRAAAEMPVTPSSWSPSEVAMPVLRTSSSSARSAAGSVRVRGVRARVDDAGEIDIAVVVVVVLAEVDVRVGLRDNFRGHTRGTATTDAKDRVDRVEVVELAVGSLDPAVVAAVLA